MSDHKMMIRADARACGMVTSTTTRVSDRWTQSPNRRASECISYFNADKSDARIFRAATPDRTITRKRDNIDSINKIADARAHHIDASMLAPIGNVD